MLTTIDLPVAAQITRANAREPYLGITLRFDSHALMQIASTAGCLARRRSAMYETR